MAGLLDDFPAYRQADVRFHIGLAELTGNARLVAMATEAQSEASDLISFIAHPPEVLEWSNAQHGQLLDALRRARSRARRAARLRAPAGHRACARWPAPVGTNSPHRAIPALPTSLQS